MYHICDVTQIEVKIPRLLLKLFETASNQKTNFTNLSTMLKLIKKIYFAQFNNQSVKYTSSWRTYTYQSREAVTTSKRILLAKLIISLASKCWNLSNEAVHDKFRLVCVSVKQLDMIACVLRINWLDSMLRSSKWYLIEKRTTFETTKLYKIDTIIVCGRRT